MDRADKIAVGCVVGNVVAAIILSRGYIVAFLLIIAAICLALIFVYNGYYFVQIATDLVESRKPPKDWNVILGYFFASIVFGASTIIATFVAISFIVNRT
ncbi:hypothetical protein [Vibrio harveyi]|uniref:hypothetical protein n=1 Tax=Vibrio harveyi TaxID=669 RepID=UPI00403FE0F6